MLGLSAEQKKEIDALQKTVDETLDKVLTDDAEEDAARAERPGPGGFAAMPAPGQIMSVSTQVTLKPTPEQKTQLVRPPEGSMPGSTRSSPTIRRSSSSRCGPISLAADRPAARAAAPGGPGGGRRRSAAFLFAGPPGGSAVFRAYDTARTIPAWPART